MEYFAVKHVATNRFLGIGRGSTYWNPEHAKDVAPRLFKRKQDAESVIRYWLLGKWRNERIHASYESFEYDDVELTYKAVPGRNKGDLIVVPIQVFEGTQEDMRIVTAPQIYKDGNTVHELPSLCFTWAADKALPTVMFDSPLIVGTAIESIEVGAAVVANMGKLQQDKSI